MSDTDRNPSSSSAGTVALAYMQTSTLIPADGILEGAIMLFDGTMPSYGTAFARHELRQTANPTVFDTVRHLSNKFRIGDREFTV